MLMRYTLRLLTLQQFQRADGADLRLRGASGATQGEAGDTRWGDDAVPDRPVGRARRRRRTAPTTPRRRSSTRTAAQRRRSAASARPTSSPTAPGAARSIEPGTHIEVERTPAGRPHAHLLRRQARPVPVHARASAPDEGLPVVVVDEEIYRRLPALLIATVDKFAQMPWKGEVQMLFGQGRRPLRAARLPLARARGLRTATPSARARCPRPRPSTVRAAAAARPDHPGRAAPDQRAARHAGRPVRDGDRPALHLGGRAARRCGPR